MYDTEPETTAGRTAVSNDASGVVAGSVVQAGSIAGSVHVHNSQPEQPVPRQLPSTPAKFVGRADELARLTEALDKVTDADSAVQVSALAGAGGTGKTWLALHWAHQHLDQFPDGQLFVDLQGFSPTDAPMDPAVAVRGFLDALGVVPDRVPPDLHTQTTLFRSLVDGKRMLIVLDNATDATQVTPLLPGSPTCKVVVTSRRHLTSLVTRHGAHHLRVGPLSDTEARQLLTTRLGADRVAAEPDAVTELVACCGGFPLALGIVAGRAHMASDAPLAVLAADLRDATTRLGVLTDDDPAVSLPAVLSWSLRALTDEQARVFGLLGIAPGPAISLMAAASLTALPPPAPVQYYAGWSRSACSIGTPMAGTGCTTWFACTPVTIIPKPTLKWRCGGWSTSTCTRHTPATGT
ncbi:ATP-binding protein [Saccharopolyspora sp. 5N102]|uniref:ATP-binding protein n=1 Tax=Saccharopolyspora sp. 5N102 TaxID=3375155 RepID=UPI0037A8B129